MNVLKKMADFTLRMIIVTGVFAIIGLLTHFIEGI